MYTQQKKHKEPQQTLRLSHEFLLSIHSKKKPLFMQAMSSSKVQIFHTSQSICQSSRKYFPIQQYKDILLGQKFYIQVYYKGKQIFSGYQPYIQAMGGQITKRITQSTTVVLTNSLTKAQYDKIKTKTHKICSKSTAILNILWIQAIYKQKTKVDKNRFLFDQHKDIYDKEEQLEKEIIIPDYFMKQLIDNQFVSEIQHYLKDSQDQIFAEILENKKGKKTNLNKLPQQGCVLVDPMKLSLFKQGQFQRCKEQLKHNPIQPFIPLPKKDKKAANKRLSANQKPIKKRLSSNINKNRMSQRVQIKKQQKKQQIVTNKQKRNNIHQRQQSDPQSFISRIKRKMQLQTSQQSQNEQNANKQQNPNKIQIQSNHSDDTQTLQNTESTYKQINIESTFKKVNIDNSHCIHEVESYMQESQNISRHNYGKSKSKSQINQKQLSTFTKNKKQYQTKQTKSIQKFKFNSKKNNLSIPFPKPLTKKTLKQQIITQIKQFLNQINYLQQNAPNTLILNFLSRQTKISNHLEQFNNTILKKFSLINKQVNDKYVIKFNILKYHKFLDSIKSSLVIRAFLAKDHDKYQQVIQQIKSIFNQLSEIKQSQDNQSNQYNQSLSNQQYIRLFSQIIEQIRQQLRLVQIYFVGDKQNRTNVLIANLSFIQTRNILSLEVVKQFYNYLKLNIFKETSSNITNSKVKQNGNNTNNKIQKIKIQQIEQIEQVSKLQKPCIQQIHNHFKASLCPLHPLLKPLNLNKLIQCVKQLQQKKLTCITIQHVKQASFVITILKGYFIEMQQYIVNKDVQVDIVINQKRGFGFGKTSSKNKIWELDWNQFVRHFVDKF